LFEISDAQLKIFCFCDEKWKKIYEAYCMEVNEARKIERILISLPSARLTFPEQLNVKSHFLVS